MANPTVIAPAARRQQEHTSPVRSADARKAVRIAFVVDVFDMGGMERCIAHLVNHLDPARFTPLLICLTKNGDAAGWIQRPRLPIIEMYKPPGNDLRTMRGLAHVLREKSVDLIHSHNWGTLLETVVARRWCPAVRHVHAVHGQELDRFRVSGLKRHVRRLLMGWGMRQTHAVVAIARSVQEWIASDCRLRPPQLQLLPNGVADPLARTPIAGAEEMRRSLGIGREAFVIGSVSRLIPLKDFASAIEAVCCLVRGGRDAHLVLVGDGPERRMLESQAVAGGLPGRVHLVGQRGNVGDWLRCFDLYINSSLTEAMSMALLEAMAANLPIVATRVGDAATLVGGPDPAGLLVPPADPAALAAAVEHLIRDPDQRRALAREGRKRYEAHYTIDRMVERYAGLYAHLMQTTAPAGV